MLMCMEKQQSLSGWLPERLCCFVFFFYKRTTSANLAGEAPKKLKQQQTAVLSVVFDF